MNEVKNKLRSCLNLAYSNSFKLYEVRC